MTSWYAIEGFIKKIEIFDSMQFLQGRAVLQNDEIAIDFEINFNIHCSHKGEK